MKSLKKRLIVALTLLLATGLSAFTRFDQPANFSGTWVLNTQKSELANISFPTSGKSTIKIIQQSPAIIMEKSITDSLGKVHTGMDTIVFDGRSQSALLGNGQILQRSITQQWSNDKQVMTLVSKFLVDNNGEPTEFMGKKTWSLTDGDRTLIIVNETVLPGRTDRIKLVYTKE